MDNESFTKLLQFSISPIALISGAALFLLSITNRLGRSIDRARQLAGDMENDPHIDDTREQLRVLLQRSNLLRNSVFLTSFSIFLSTLMILSLAVHLFLGLLSGKIILVCLFLSIICLCASLVFFLWDISLALEAVKVEVKKRLK